MLGWKSAITLFVKRQQKSVTFKQCAERISKGCLNFSCWQPCQVCMSQSRSNGKNRAASSQYGMAAICREEGGDGSFYSLCHCLEARESHEIWQQAWRVGYLRPCLVSEGQWCGLEFTHLPSFVYSRHTGLLLDALGQRRNILYSADWLFAG